MKKFFLFFFLTYFVFFFLFPPFQNPDEAGHYETAYWISRGIYPYVSESFKKNTHPYSEEISQPFNMVIQHPMIIPDYTSISKSKLQHKSQYSSTEEKQFIPISNQAYNPPIYYLVAALFIKIAEAFHLSLFTQFYFTRGASSLFYFGTIFIAYKILTLIFKKQKVIKGVLLFFALNPLFIQAGVGVSPDIAVTFFSTLFLYAVLTYLKFKTSSIKTAIILGFIAGLAALSKITGITLIPVILIFFYFHYHNLKTWIIFSIIFLGTFAILQIPWELLNYSRYHKLFIEGVALGIPLQHGYAMSPVQAAIQTLFSFRHTFMHFSGFLGWNESFPTPIIFIPYTVIFVVLFLLGTYTKIKDKDFSSSIFLLFITSLFVFFFLLGFLRKIYYHPGWETGARNMLPIFLPMIIFIYYGITKILRKYTIYIPMVLSYFAIFYYFYILVFVLIARYYV